MYRPICFYQNHSFYIHFSIYMSRNVAIQSVPIIVFSSRDSLSIIYMISHLPDCIELTGGHFVCGRYR